MGRTLPPTPPVNVNRPHGFIASRGHQIALIEAGAEGNCDPCPGVFEILCSCGWQAWTAWGEEQAKEMALRHQREYENASKLIHVRERPE